MKRYEFFLGHGEIVTGEAIGGEWVRYSDHVEAMKRIAGDSAQQEPVAWLFDNKEDGKHWYDTPQPMGRPVYAAPAPGTSSLTAEDYAPFYAAHHAGARAQQEPANPYAAQGSLEEAWQRGFDGQRGLAAPGSNYDKVWHEGAAARKAYDAGRAAPATASPAEPQSDRTVSQIMEALKNADNERALSFSAKEMRAVLNLWNSAKQLAEGWRNQAAPSASPAAAKKNPRDGEDDKSGGLTIESIERTATYCSEFFASRLRFLIGRIRALESASPAALTDERDAFEEVYAKRFAGGERANMPRRANGEYVKAQAEIAWSIWVEASRVARQSAVAEFLERTGASKEGA